MQNTDESKRFRRCKKQYNKHFTGLLGQLEGKGGKGYSDIIFSRIDKRLLDSGS